MEFIHEFWVWMFPWFENGYDFLYVFLDITSVLVMIEALIVLPCYLLFGRTGKTWND